MCDTSGWCINIYVYSSKQLHGPHCSVSEERERQRERERDRQTERETERHRERETDRERQRQRERERERDYELGHYHREAMTLRACGGMWGHVSTSTSIVHFAQTRTSCLWLIIEPS